MNIDLMMSTTVILTVLTWAFLITILAMLFFKRKESKEAGDMLSRIDTKISDMWKEVIGMGKDVVELNVKVKNIESGRDVEKLERTLGERIRDLERNMQTEVDLKILQATGFSPQRKAQDTELGKIKRKMYEIDIEKILERIKSLKASVTKELGIEIRKLEKLVREMKSSNYWSKSIKAKISSFLNNMQSRWKKEPEFKELFKMEEKRI